MQKVAAQAGVGTGPFLVVVATGLVGTAVEGDSTLTRAGGAYAALFGLLWAAGVGAIAVALGRYGARISQLAPLYNTNTLVAVLAGLAVLGEWQAVHPARLLVATGLPIGGGLLAATAAR